MADLDLDPETLARFAGEVPRYTSYPTAVEFSPTFDAAAYEDRLQAARAPGRSDPYAFYVHLPFCRSLCHFCGCHALVARSEDRVQRYLDALGREAALLGAEVGSGRTMSELHFGGGSPSVLAPADIERLFTALHRHFRVAGNAEISVEVDPRTVDRDRLRTWRAAGVRRVSMGFQDLDPGVQEAIGRHQSSAVSHAAYEEARHIGFEGINVDLCYGLPRQTEETFARTLADVVALRPDRVAIFGYAHVPWLRPLQRRIDTATLPATDLRVRLLLAARRALLGAGYRAIGMDHFALPGDSLTRALDAGRLHRNFQGYTTTTTRDLFGLGLSAIGDVGGAFVQNQRGLREYYAAVDAGRLPVERGVGRTADDELRGHLIRRVMCDFALDFRSVEAVLDARALEPALEARAIEPGLVFRRAFAPELDDLARLGADGLLVLDEGGFTLTDLGRVFVRNVAAVFDAYRRKARSDRKTAQPRFSAAV